MVVVIGCPRSGTGFISQLLKEHGLDVGHEVWGKNGISDWRLTWAREYHVPPPEPPPKPKPKPVLRVPKPLRSPFRTDYPPDPPELPTELPTEPPPEPAPPVEEKYTFNVVHQVRHPLKVIASLITIAPVSWELIACHTRLTVEDPMLLRSMMAWLYMNELAYCRAEYTYRVENIRQEFDEICRRAGFEVQFKTNYETSETANGRDHPPVTWKMLEAEDAKLAERIKEAAHAYGYAL